MIDFCLRKWQRCGAIGPWVGHLGPPASRPSDPPLLHAQFTLLFVHLREPAGVLLVMGNPRTGAPAAFGGHCVSRAPIGMEVSWCSWAHEVIWRVVIRCFIARSPSIGMLTNFRLAVRLKTHSASEEQHTHGNDIGVLLQTVGLDHGCLYRGRQE